MGNALGVQIGRPVPGVSRSYFVRCHSNFILKHFHNQIRGMFVQLLQKLRVLLWKSAMLVKHKSTLTSCTCLSAISTTSSYISMSCTAKHAGSSSHVNRIFWSGVVSVIF